LNVKESNAKESNAKGALVVSAATIAALAIFVLCVLVVSFNKELYAAVSWKPFNETNIGALVSTLLFISIAAQSTLEVFISNFRRSRRSELESDYEQADRMYKKFLEADSITDLDENSEELQEFEELLHRAVDTELALTEYRATTRRIVSITALLLGFCVSAAGVRVLQPFVAKMASDGLQVQVFHAVDIILTAGLVAGGSEGINRLTSVYDSLTSAAAKKVSEKDSPAVGGL